MTPIVAATFPARRFFFLVVNHWLSLKLFLRIVTEAAAQLGAIDTTLHLPPTSITYLILVQFTTI